MRQFGMTDGRQLKAARAALDLSQKDLAELAGLHRNSVYRLEGMGTLPRHSIAAARIEDALMPLGVIFDADPHEAAVRFRLAAGQR